MTNIHDLILEYWNDLPKGIVFDERVMNPTKETLIPEHSFKLLSPVEQVMYMLWFISSSSHLSNMDYLNKAVLIIEQHLMI